MRLEELVEKYKTGYNFEKITGISHVNWINWNKYGYIPIESQRKIEQATAGLFKASLDDLPTKE